MCKLVSIHIRLLTECFFTHNTGMWTLTTVCKLMYLHSRLQIE